MELLMLCHVFPQWEEILQAENNQILNQLNGPLRQDFVCRTHAFPPLLQLWDVLQVLWHQIFPHYFNSGDALREKTSQPMIRAEILDGGEDVEGDVHHTSWAGLPMSLEGYELRFDPCHHRPADARRIYRWVSRRDLH